MATMVKVFGERIPFLLGNDYVAGFLLGRTPHLIPYAVEDSEYKRGFITCVFLLSTCTTLYTRKEFIGYHSARISDYPDLVLLNGFRKLDYVQYFELPTRTAMGEFKHVTALRVAQCPRYPLPLAEFTNLEVVHLSSYPGLEESVVLSTWPPNAKTLCISGAHEMRVEYTGVLPVRLLVLGTIHCQFSDWKIFAKVEEIHFKKGGFGSYTTTGGIVFSLEALPCLHTLVFWHVVTCNSAVVDLSKLKALKKVSVLHRLFGMPELRLPSDFSDFSQENDWKVATRSFVD